MCDKPYTSADKWTVSIMSGLLFFLVSSPYVFSLTNEFTSRIGLDISNKVGCPNLAGLILHASVFTILLRILMSKRGDWTGGSKDIFSETNSAACMKPYTSKDKWVVSMVGGLLFLLIASPFFYEAVDSLTSSFGLKIADRDGCPNLAGVILHTCIFVVVVRLLMR